MTNLSGLFEKEFKNLYALEKQIQETLMNITHVEDKKLSKRIFNFLKTNASDYKKVKSMANDLAINPGNTTDSVVAEMLENISNIDSDTIEQKVKEAGLLASFNRLANYKIVSYFNARRMAKALSMSKIAKQLKKSRKKNEKHAAKFKKLAKKQVFQEAVEV